MCLFYRFVLGLENTCSFHLYTIFMNFKFNKQAHILSNLFWQGINLLWTELNDRHNSLIVCQKSRNTAIGKKLIYKFNLYTKCLRLFVQRLQHIKRGKQRKMQMKLQMLKIGLLSHRTCILIFKCLLLLPLGLSQNQIGTEYLKV